MKNIDKMISFLLKNANSSIVYRIKSEILQDISEEEENKLQELILSEKIVQEIINCQKDNGWLGNGYHGSNKNAGQFTNMEAGVKYLAEKGVRKDAGVLKRAMIAFKELSNTDPCYRNSWKTKENSEMLAESVHKIMKNDRQELIGLKADSWVGYVLGTCGCFPSQGFKLVDENDGVPYYHLEYLIWLAKCGVVPYSPVLKEIIETIYNSVNEDGICEIAVQDSLFKDWGTYAGLQLEVDWKSKVRKQCDITFRTLQLCYYSGIDLEQ